MSSKKKSSHESVKRASKVVDRSSEGHVRARESDSGSMAEATLRGGPVSAASILQLQSLAGNSAVARNVDEVVQRQPIPNNTSLDMAECSLIGLDHEGDDRSFASVKSEAWLSSPGHRVIYEIKWDAAVAPDGNHLGQTAGQASDWIVDLSQHGEAIGDRDGAQAPYFDDDFKPDKAQGQYFYYTDPIQQSRKQGGSWWFRVKVVDAEGKVLSQSHDVQVDWDSPTM